MTEHTPDPKNFRLIHVQPRRIAQVVGPVVALFGREFAEALWKRRLHLVPKQPQPGQPPETPEPEGDVDE